jgi:hypothetical protein
VAIAAARALVAAELSVPVHFVDGNVYDMPALVNSQYDIPLVIGIDHLAAGYPGGPLYLAEGHPSTLSFGEVDDRLMPVRRWQTPVTAALFMITRRPTRATQLH